MFENLRNTLNVTENIIGALSYKRQNAIDTINTFNAREDDLNDWEKSDLAESKEILVQLEIIEKKNSIENIKEQITLQQMTNENMKNAMDQNPLANIKKDD